MTAPLSAQETLRLAKLQDYGILDTLPEALYDDITTLAAHICQTPAALVSLIDGDRQWFKSKVGVDADLNETPRSMAFCAHTIQSTEVMIVKDTLLHPTFCFNPLVTGSPFIRFYAGAPLITADGYALGSLCVLDYRPHQLDPSQIQALKVLSHQVIAQIELSYQRHQLKLSNQHLEARIKERTAGLTTALHRLLRAQTTLANREARSRHNALHDSLTQLPNRSYFLQRLTQAVQLNHRQPSHHYAVLFIDLDDFKSINDTLGHEIGDQLLIHVAKQIKILLRKSDLVARMGGDEFAVLLDSLPNEELSIAAVKRLQQQLQIPVVIDEQQIAIGASIGVTFSSHGYRQPEAALKDADTAMYQAKQQAKQRVQQQLQLQLQTHPHPSPILIQNELAAGAQQFAIFDTQMQNHAKAQLTLEEDLQQSLIQNQFHFHYQPIFDLPSQQLYGFEMLLRWQHPIRGYIPADDFIESAEEIGIMQQLCAHIIESACRHLAQWRSHPAWANISLHVNLSLSQIRYSALIVQWKTALQKYDLPAAAFQLEFAEQTLLSSDPSVTTVLKQLKSMGFRLCIDDFGRGQSSLSRLHQLAVNTLKVDRTFVQTLSHSPELNAQGLNIAKTIVDFGRSANIAVIAEGVETATQMAALLSFGCHQAQGFWLSEALPPEKITLLATNG
ncbi:MAG: EAL domain-containing protein [Phormidesmis sp.]